MSQIQINPDDRKQERIDNLRKEIANLQKDLVELEMDDEINISLKHIVKYHEDFEMDIKKHINCLMGLSIKQLKNEIKEQKNSHWYYNSLGLKLKRDGKVTKKGMVKNLTINLLELQTQDCYMVHVKYTPGIIHLVDNYYYTGL